MQQRTMEQLTRALTVYLISLILVIVPTQMISIISVYTYAFIWHLLISEGLKPVCIDVISLIMGTKIIFIKYYVVKRVLQKVVRIIYKL